MLERIRISEEDNATVDLLVKAYPETEELKEGFYRMFPEHEKLLIEILLIDNPELKLYEHHLLLRGLLARSQGLLGAALREALKRNGPAVLSLLRSQCETLAAACYVEKFPDKLRTVLLGSREKGAKIESPNILTQIDHASKKYHGLREDYDQLSELVHPNAASHFSSIEVLDEEHRTVRFSSKGYLDKKDIVQVIRMAYYWTDWFLKTARSIHQQFRKGIAPSKGG